jgi:hypothetical protein
VVDSTSVTASVSGQWKQVEYRNILLDVPASWPVIDLAKNPRQCVLLNVHAVYLGHEGPDAQCPARAIGRTDAVQIETLDAQAQHQVLASPADATINGQEVVMEPDSATRSVVASFTGLGVTVLATYANDATTARHIVQSVRQVAGSSS